MFWTVTTKLLEGFGVSCTIFFVTLIAALPLGLVIAFGSMCKFKPLAWLTRTFVWIIRGTPLMLQVMIVYYVPSLLWDVRPLGRLTAVLVAFIINYAAYFSEIYRGGIESVSKGQYEAGQVLGMTRRQIFFNVILLQVVKRIVPPMGNEFMTLVKDTSLANVVAYAEITLKAKQQMQNYASLVPLFIAGVFYFAMATILTALFSFIEKKLNYYR